MKSGANVHIDHFGHKLALRPAGFSPKDFTLEHLFGAIMGTAIPDRLDDYDLFPHIFNQADEGSCGPSSVRTILGAFCAINGIKDPQFFAVNFLYWCARYLMNCTDEDSGVDNRQLFNALLKFGMCLEASCPYGPDTLFKQPSRAAFQEALNYQLKGGFCRLRSVDEAVIAKAQPRSGVVIAIEVWESFYKIGVDGKVPYPNKKTERLLGLHDLNASGYDKTLGQLNVMNSWDVTFGDRGRIYLPFDTTILKEIWAVRGDECGLNDDSLNPGSWEMFVRRLRGMA